MKTAPPSKANVLDAADETLPGKSDGGPSAPHPSPDDEMHPEMKAGGASSPYRSPELPRGTNIGRHILLDKIGEGGMGIVYAAYDSDLDRKVAIKFLSPDRARPRKIAPPSRGTSHGAARSSERRLRIRRGNARQARFLIMEFVEGVNLSGWLAEKPRTPSEILAVFRAAGQGLAAAHAAGIIHRDFKPGNVLVDRQGRARVTDFGLARARRGEADDNEREHDDDAQVDEDAASDVEGGSFASSLLDASLTRTGEVHGTPSYMAPEQHSDGPTDARSDQFSFRVALYEGLYREHPFRGANAAELVKNVLTGGIHPAPAHSSGPRWCRRVLLRGLRTKPEERFPSMDALLAALERPLRTARQRIGLAVAGTVGVAFIAGGFVFGREPDEDRCTGGRAELAKVWGPTNATDVHAAFVATDRPHAQSSAARVVQRLRVYGGEWTAMHRATCQATARGEQSADLLDRRMACLGRRLSQVGALVELFIRRADGGVVDKAIDMVSKLEPLAQCADVALLEQMALPADPAKRARIAELQRQVDQADAEQAAGRPQVAADGARAVIQTERALDFAPLRAQARRVLGRSLCDLNGSADAREELLGALSLAERTGDGRLAVRLLIDLLPVIGLRQKHYSEARLIGRMIEAALERPALQGEIMTFVRVCWSRSAASPARKDTSSERWNSTVKRLPLAAALLPPTIHLRHLRRTLSASPW